MGKITSTWFYYILLTLVVRNVIECSGELTTKVTNDTSSALMTTDVWDETPGVFQTDVTIDTSSDDIKNPEVINVTVILPFDTLYMASVKKTGPAIILAFEYVKKQKLLSNNTVRLKFRDSNCSNKLAPQQMIRAIQSTVVNLFLGPCCDLALAPVARLVGYLNTPLLTAGALTTDYTAPKTTPDTEFFLTTRTGFGFSEMVEFVFKFFESVKWEKVMLMYDKDALIEVTGEHSCKLFMSTMVEHLKSGFKYGQFDLVSNNVNASLKENIAKSLGGEYASKKPDFHSISVIIY